MLTLENPFAKSETDVLRMNYNLSSGIIITSSPPLPPKEENSIFSKKYRCNFLCFYRHSYSATFNLVRIFGQLFFLFTLLYIVQLLYCSLKPLMTLR